MRADEDKNNQGVFISGATGSGKSRMTQRLAATWARVIYVDPIKTVRDIPPDGRARTWAAAKTKLLAGWPAPSFRFACSFSDDLEYRYLFHAMRGLMEAENATGESFLLVIDEVDLWSSPGKILDSLSWIMRYGRHHGCSWIANCRADVQTHRDVRMNAQELLLFRQGMLSAEMQRELRSACRVRSVERMEPGLLRKHDRTQGAEAVEGMHFIALPDPWDDWYPTWLELAQERPGQLGGGAAQP